MTSIAVLDLLSFPLPEPSRTRKGVESFRPLLPDVRAAYGETVHEIDRSEQLSIDAARRGDGHAFDYLVQKYMRKALSVSWSIVRNSAEAEDLTQEAFVKAFQRIGSMKGSDSFGPWLFRIVTNLSLDHLRRQKRRAFDELSELHPSKSRTDAPSTEKLAARIDAAIESLPDMQRIVARLFLVDDFSHGEIAAMLDVNEGTVRSHLFHARKKLQEKLSDVYEEVR